MLSPDELADLGPRFLAGSKGGLPRVIVGLFLLEGGGRRRDDDDEYISPFGHKAVGDLSGGQDVFTSITRAPHRGFPVIHFVKVKWYLGEGPRVP